MRDKKKPLFDSSGQLDGRGRTAAKEKTRGFRLGSRSRKPTNYHICTFCGSNVTLKDKSCRCGAKLKRNPI